MVLQIRLRMIVGDTDAGGPCSAWHHGSRDGIEPGWMSALEDRILLGTTRLRSCSRRARSTLVSEHRDLVNPRWLSEKLARLAHQRLGNRAIQVGLTSLFGIEGVEDSV
jgi:hypothetical protein